MQVMHRDGARIALGDRILQRVASDDEKSEGEPDAQPDLRRRPHRPRRAHQAPRNAVRTVHRMPLGLVSTSRSIPILCRRAFCDATWIAITPASAGRLQQG
jgi:hypothetical protein